MNSHEHNQYKMTKSPSFKDIFIEKIIEVFQIYIPDLTERWHQLSDGVFEKGVDYLDSIQDNISEEEFINFKKAITAEFESYKDRLSQIAQTNCPPEFQKFMKEIFKKIIPEFEDRWLFMINEVYEKGVETLKTIEDDIANEDFEKMINEISQAKEYKSRFESDIFNKFDELLKQLFQDFVIKPEIWNDLAQGIFKEGINYLDKYKSKIAKNKFDSLKEKILHSQFYIEKFKTTQDQSKIFNDNLKKMFEELLLKPEIWNDLAQGIFKEGINYLDNYKSKIAKNKFDSLKSNILNSQIYQERFTSNIFQVNKKDGMKKNIETILMNNVPEFKHKFPSIIDELIENKTYELIEIQNDVAEEDFLKLLDEIKMVFPNFNLNNPVLIDQIPEEKKLEISHEICNDNLTKLQKEIDNIFRMLQRNWRKETQSKLISDIKTSNIFIENKMKQINKQNINLNEDLTKLKESIEEIIESMSHLSKKMDNIINFTDIDFEFSKTYDNCTKLYKSLCPKDIFHESEIQDLLDRFFLFSRLSLEEISKKEKALDSFKRIEFSKTLFENFNKGLSILDMNFNSADVLFLEKAFDSSKILVQMKSYQKEKPSEVSRTETRILNNIRKLNEHIKPLDSYDLLMFNKIYDLKKICLDEIILKGLKNTEASFLDQVFPCIITNLKKGVKFDQLSSHEFLWKINSNLQGFDTRTVIISLLERYQHHQMHLGNLLTKLGICLPFIYPPLNQKHYFSYVIPLKAFSNHLNQDNPFVISIVDENIGKSTLLKLIYSKNFNCDKRGIIGIGADIVFTCDESNHGFNIVDFHGDAIENFKIIDYLLKLLPKEYCWILVQSIEKQKLIKILNLLENSQIKKYQIIGILRDVTETQYLTKLYLRESLQLRRINESDQYFINDLIELKRNLFGITKIGSSREFPNKDDKKKFNSENLYNYIESNAGSLNSDSFIIPQMFPDKYQNLEDNLKNKLNSLELNDTQFQDKFFVHLSLANKIEKCDKDKTELTNENLKETETKKTILDRSIKQYKDTKSNADLHPIANLFLKLFLEKDFLALIIIERRILAWQSPIINPLIKKRKELYQEVENLQKINQLEKEEKSEVQSNPLLEQKKKDKKKIENEIKDIGCQIDSKTINHDLFMRELLSVYSDEEFLDRSKRKEEKVQYLESYCDFLQQGNEIEIINWDNNSFNTKIVGEIFENLESRMGEEASYPFVVSVIGPQSTGKSTLLNMLFGSNFQMSAGRCTKGLYASIFKTTYQKAKSLMILDTEGLLSIEKSCEEYDKRLTLFSMACSNIMLINLNGEINSSMKKILQISLFAAQKLNLIKSRPILFFILRNMNDLNIERQREMVNGIKSELNAIAKMNDLDLNQVIDFRGDESFFLMYSAFDKKCIYDNEKKELFETSETNEKFGQLIQELRIKIFHESEKEFKYKSLRDWVTKASELWKSIAYYNNIFSLDGIIELNQRTNLSNIIKDIIELNIEDNNNDKTLRSILNNKLNQIEKSNIEFNEDIRSEFILAKENFSSKVRGLYQEKTKTVTFISKLIEEFEKQLLESVASCTDQMLSKITELNEEKKAKQKAQDHIKKIQQEAENHIIEIQKKKGNILQIEKEQIFLQIKNRIVETKKSMIKQLNDLIIKEDQAIIQSIKKLMSNAYELFGHQNTFFGYQAITDCNETNLNNIFTDKKDVKIIYEKLKIFFEFEDNIKNRHDTPSNQKKNSNFFKKC